jgi:WhiB family redox-sensing transcriptional regulator
MLLSNGETFAGFITEGEANSFPEQLNGMSDCSHTTEIVHLVPFIGTAAEARQAWVSKARCRSTDPDDLFVRGAAQREAAVICRHCPVTTECLAEALDNRMEFGVWGGMTERERRALLKQHPEVDSWANLFATRRKHGD